MTPVFSLHPEGSPSQWKSVPENGGGSGRGGNTVAEVSLVVLHIQEALESLCKNCGEEKTVRVLCTNE